MTRNLIIFAACFLVGAVITVAIRTARHDAYGQQQASAPAAPPPAADPHAGHAAPAAPATAAATVAPTAAAAPVNTICAICGMGVDPQIPSATYQGRLIGFGCKACPATFAANPDRYGPAALANQVVAE